MKDNIQNEFWKDYQAFNDIRKVQTGTWIIHGSDTTLDPVGVQMGKQARKIQIVNALDFEKCMFKHHWDHEIMRSYVESISTIPEQPLEPTKVIISNIYNGSLLRDTYSGEIKWFNNSWGNSWEKNTVPCYWTKSTDKDDQQSRSYYEYNRRRPNESVRVVLSNLINEDELRSSFNEFLCNHSDAEEIHVWIQGRAVFNGTNWDIKRVRKFLEHIYVNERNSIPRNVEVYDHLEHYDIVPKGISLGGEFFELFINRKLENMTTSELMATVEDKVNVTIIPIKLKEVAKIIGLGGTVIHHRQYLVSEEGFGMEDAEHSMIYNLSNRGTKMLNHITDIKEGGLYGLISKDPLKYYSKTLFGMFRTASSLDSMKKAINFYWTSKVEKVSLESHYPGHPLRVVPWRVSNMGLITVKGCLSQAFPNTKICKEFPEMRGIIHQMLDRQRGREVTAMMYVNYNPFVKMRRFRPDDEVDFVWVEEKGKYYMAKPYIDDNVYIIEDWSLFMGLGSVVCAWHSTFGLLRDNESLYEQFTAKVNYATHEPSGHMISASLSFLSHLLWYLQEITINIKTKKSIYLLPFNEPRGGEFHSKYEYLSSIIELKKYFKGKGSTAYKYMPDSFRRIMMNIAVLDVYVNRVLFGFTNYESDSVFTY